MSGSTSLGFPYPTTGDAFCGTGLPAVNAIQQLALSVQAWLTANIDTPLVAPQTYYGPARVRVSRDVFTYKSGDPILFDTVEFNVGTPTDLSVYQAGPQVGSGIWLVSLEVVMLPSGDTTQVQITEGSPFTQAVATAVVDTSLGDLYGGGTSAHMVTRVPGTFVPLPAFLTVKYTTGPANVQYLAMTAIRLSDVF